MSKNNSWFKLSMVKPGAPAGIMFGPCQFANQQCALYPDRKYKLNSTILWIPEKKLHVGIASYVDAVRNRDEEALKRLDEMGIPRGVNFGYGPNDDLTSMYKVDSKPAAPRKKKADSCAVMRAKFPAMFEDGTTFHKGEIVKIVFRKKFVKETASGSKRFENAYYKPTAEEIAEFLKSEGETAVSART